MYADFGRMSIKLLGACMRKRLCAKYAVVGWESMERSGACLTVFACLTVGSRLTVGTYTLHAYPLAWAQGPPGPRAHTIKTINQANNKTIKSYNNQTIKQSNDNLIKNMCSKWLIGLGPWAPGAVGP